MTKRKIRTRIRKRRSGDDVGGVIFTAGPLSHMLGNRVYLGEINHKDLSYPGEHKPIIKAEQFEQVQQIRRSVSTGPTSRYEHSGALLAGLIYDDRGNRMSPTHVKKGNIRYCYYQSSVLAHGLKAKAGSVERVPAREIEQVVVSTVLNHSGLSDADFILKKVVERIDVLPTALNVKFVSVEGTGPIESITIPWVKPSNTRKREILGDQDHVSSRPIRTEARRRLLKGIAQGRQWLNMLVTEDGSDISSIAQKHQLSEKTVRSTISLAFLAPDIVQAAIDGQLPRGLGISAMTDLPADWAEQRKQLGLG